MAEEKKSSWVTRYGVPSIVLSVAVFVFQQQQQTFDRLQRILEGGYQFYSGGRTELQHSGDADRELSLLKIVGNAFPNIYCEVRQDIYQRSSVVQPEATVDANGRKLIDSPELKRLWAGLQAADRPVRREYPENIIDAWASFASKGRNTCPALASLDTTLADEATASVAAAGDAAKDDAKTGEAVLAAPAPPPPAPAAASPSPLDTASGAGAAAGPGSTKPGGGGGASRATSGASPAPPPAVVQAPAPALKAAPATMRVFFQIPSNSPPDRETRVIEGPRAELAPYNYSVMRGVERIPSTRFQKSGEVRYFGKEQEMWARQLAAWLTWQFRDEHLDFVVSDISSWARGMPPQNIEVWVPNPPNAP